MYSEKRDLLILKTALLAFLEGLQHSLNALHHYCNKWDLRVNIDKTNVIIFNKNGRLFKNVHFKFMYSEKRDLLILKTALLTFLHKRSTAAEKLPDGLNSIP
jgi:hypothetical protein